MTRDASTNPTTSAVRCRRTSARRPLPWPNTDRGIGGTGSSFFDQTPTSVVSALPPRYSHAILFRSKLTADGRVTVPAAIRRRLGIGPGSVVEWVLDGEQITIRDAGKYSFDDIHRALFAKRPRFRTDEELKQGIARHLRNKHARS